jgi:hypothetical protein
VFSRCSCKCFIWMLHMLQWLAIHVCCKCMFQIFQLLSGCCICCSGYTHMLQVYVSKVSPVSDAFCSKCFMLQVFSLAEREASTGGEGSHVRGQSPRPCVAIGTSAQQHGCAAACEQQAQTRSNTRVAGAGRVKPRWLSWCTCIMVK